MVLFVESQVAARVEIATRNKPPSKSFSPWTAKMLDPRVVGKGRDPFLPRMGTVFIKPFDCSLSS